MSSERDGVDRILRQVNINWADFPTERAHTHTPIKELVFSARGIRFLENVGSDNVAGYAILRGVIENGRAIVSQIVEIFGSDMAAGLENAMREDQANDGSVSVIGLYQPGKDSEVLTDFLRPPFSISFVICGARGLPGFCVDVATLDVNDALTRITSVRTINMPEM